MLTARYKDAMSFAATLHDGQLRKGSEVAYLSHLLSVSALVMENGGDEDESIAALLHDAIEDQGDDYASERPDAPRLGREALRRDIGLRFGARVRAIVEACTDDEDARKVPAGESGSVEAWRARKQRHLASLDLALDAGVLRVACADKLHNARTILLDFVEHGDALWSRFRAASRENMLWYFESMAALFRRHAERMQDAGLARLAGELEVVAARIRALGAAVQGSAR